MDETILGHKVSDKVTGYEGIATGVCKYMYGCMKVLITPKVIDNKLEDGTWFDVGRIIDHGLVIDVQSVQIDNPGDDINPPIN